MLRFCFKVPGVCHSTTSAGRRHYTRHEANRQTRQMQPRLMTSLFLQADSWMEFRLFSDRLWVSVRFWRDGQTDAASPCLEYHRRRALPDGHRAGGQHGVQQSFPQGRRGLSSKELSRRRGHRGADIRPIPRHQPPGVHPLLREAQKGKVREMVRSRRRAEDPHQPRRFQGGISLHALCRVVQQCVQRRSF